jgi:hypothetical protein
MKLYYSATAILFVSGVLITWVLCANYYRCPESVPRVEVVVDTVQASMYRKMLEAEIKRADRSDSLYWVEKSGNKKTKAKYHAIKPNTMTEAMIFIDSVYLANE